MTIYLNWKFTFAYKSKRSYVIRCLSDTNQEYLTSLTLPDADEVVIEEDNVHIRHVGPDTVQILNSSHKTEIADKVVKILKRTRTSADAWKEMLNYYQLFQPSIFHVYHVHGSCSFCGLFEEYKGYSKVEFICTDVSELTEETASVLRVEEHLIHCRCGGLTLNRAHILVATPHGFGGFDKNESNEAN
jgi:hypothetical protein